MPSKMKKLKNQDLPRLIALLPTAEQRLRRLQALSSSGALQGREKRLDLRAKFDQAKHALYDITFQLCLVCSSKATIRHHIIPLKRRGGNGRKNICYLCTECHASIHPWL